MARCFEANHRLRRENRVSSRIEGQAGMTVTDDAIRIAALNRLGVLLHNPGPILIRTSSIIPQHRQGLISRP